MQAVSQNNDFDMLAIDGNMDLPGSKRGAYDYFIRDYQGNVRMILTEETHIGRNTCTMETGRKDNEEPVFGQDAPDNEVANTRTATPSGWSSNTSGSVSKLLAPDGGSGAVGPNVLLKVISGDHISGIAPYYYENDVVNNSDASNLMGSVLVSLVGAITGSSATNSITKGASGNIKTALDGSLPFSIATGPDGYNPDGNTPKAYLTILFFDERFNFIEEGSISQRVEKAGDGADPLTLANVVAPKNGYAYIYVSNENKEEPVYFDDIQVTHEHKQIIEENHYYSYGLKIAAISSRKFSDPNEGSIKNQYLYNDKELWEDGDLNWYDYGFRNYDPQIGRFPQLDPLTWEYPGLTNYQYASCDPIANIDLDGLEGFTSIAPASQMGKALNDLGLSVGNLALTKSLETVFITSVKAASGVSTLSKVATVTSMARIGMQHSEDNGILRQLKASENLAKYPRHNDWNDWWHPEGSASSEVKDGVSWTSEGGQGEPPHVKEEYRNLSNQQGENLDGLSIIMGGATRAPFELRPNPKDFKDPWTWGNWGGDASVKTMEAKEAFVKAMEPTPIKYQTPVKDVGSPMESYYTEYYPDSKGHISSTYTAGRPGDTTIKGINGTRDTIRSRSLAPPKTTPTQFIYPKKKL